MNVEDIMTRNPVCCTPDSGLRDVAQMMVDCDCGEIPVVESFESLIPVGVITDRDIVCRVVAKGMNPLDTRGSECMTRPMITVDIQASLDDTCQLLEENQIRRVPVVDGGKICGIVSLADIAENTKRKESGDVLRSVSTPSASASNAV